MASPAGNVIFSCCAVIGFVVCSVPDEERGELRKAVFKFLTSLMDKPS